jgi:hypothetical protein
MTAKELYGKDFVEWTQYNAALLRAGRLSEIDVEHLAEEIEDMGTSQRHALSSRLLVLIAHLLKLQAEPSSWAAKGWRTTVKVQRFRINRLLRSAPSLRNEVEGDIAEIHHLAVSKASAGTRLDEAHFPKTCPFTVDQLLDPDYFPG